MTKTDRRPACEILILAAAGLDEEWTECELTVAAWQADPERFGLKGYQDQYPDHKRVYCELVKQNPTFAKRVRPTVWSLTPTGRAMASRLSKGLPKRRATDQFIGISLMRAINHPVYRRWKDDPSMPDDSTDLDQFVYQVRRTRTELAVLVDGLEPEDKPSFSGLADFLTAMNYRFGED